MGRAPCCDKANVKKGPWSPEEDSKLKEYIDKYGTGGNWIALPQKAGLKRCGKSCRLRWLNYLRPNIKHGEFSEEEDRIICTLFTSIGSRWSIIAAQLPGRTDNDIKNYWNTKLKKKLRDMQMAPPPPPPPPPHHHRSKPPTFPVSNSSLYQFQNQPLIHHQPLSSLMHSKDLNYNLRMTSYTPALTTSPGFELIMPNTTLTNYSSLFHQSPPLVVGSMHYNLPPVKKHNLNLIMFGSEGSCITSSDGSHNNNNQVKQEELGFQLEESEDQNKFMMQLNDGNGTTSAPAITSSAEDDYVHNNSQWGNNNNNSTRFGDYDLEDVKQLINNNNGSSISNSLLFSVDENKTSDHHEEKVMYFY